MYRSSYANVYELHFLQRDAREKCSKDTRRKNFQRVKHVDNEKSYINGFGGGKWVDALAVRILPWSMRGRAKEGTRIQTT
jgi:hypothetical protein